MCEYGLAHPFFNSEIWFDMGVYISQSDIEDIFGIDNVRIWSNLANENSSANSARITNAIKYAEAEIENRFRNGRYAIPFVNGGSVLVNWIASFAGIWLFEHRPVFNEEEAVGFDDLRESIDSDIEQYLSGQRLLPAGLSASTDVTAPVVIID